MKIPTVSQLEMDVFVQSRRDGNSYTPEIILVGSENSLSEEDLENFFGEIQTIFMDFTQGSKTRADFRKLETAIAPSCLLFFKKLPPEAKFTPGFWSYLSVRLSDIVEWRHPVKNKKGWEKNFVATHKPSDFVDGFLPRITIRSLIASESPIAMSLELQDFWRSHILRVKTGFSKAVSIAFAEHAVSKGFNTDESRDFTKKVKAARSNILFEALTDSQAKKVIETLA